MKIYDTLHIILVAANFLSSLPFAAITTLFANDQFHFNWHLYNAHLNRIILNLFRSHLSLKVNFNQSFERYILLDFSPSVNCFFFFLLVKKLWKLIRSFSSLSPTRNCNSSRSFINIFILPLLFIYVPLFISLSLFSHFDSLSLFFRLFLFATFICLFLFFRLFLFYTFICLFLSVYLSFSSPFPCLFSVCSILFLFSFACLSIALTSFSYRLLVIITATIFFSV